MDQPFRLTSLAHGGGCGCKLAPAVLRQILAAMPVGASYANMMVGVETGDDAAVYRLNDRQAVIATTDFFTPIVDDPRDFGRIAASNALSDVYAMGGAPIMALAIVGMPVGRVPIEMVQAIIEGGASICAEAGIPVAGGHSIDSAEPIYGLVAIGLVHPDRVLRNAGARAGDRLILTKGLGIGIYGAALKRGELGQELYREMMKSTTKLNVLGAELPDIGGVHAVTDVTGFGLIGHGLEMTRAAGLGCRIVFADLPVLAGVADLVAAGVRTGASARNWMSFAPEVELAAELPSWTRDLLCDPQTSGGLLIAVDPDSVSVVMGLARAQGFEAARVIGWFGTEPGGVTVV